MKKVEILKLAQKVSKGDSVAFKEIYDYYFDRLFLFSLRYVKSRELAEEILSDVFLKIWKNRVKLPSVSNLDTFLYVSVKNQSLNYINKYLKNSNNLLSIDEINLEFAIDNFTPESNYMVEELKNDLDEIINNLPPKCRNAFYLVKEDGLSYKEAGKVLGISPFTVKNQVLKAVKRLEEGLEERVKSEQAKMQSTKMININKYKFMVTIFSFFQLISF